MSAKRRFPSNDESAAKSCSAPPSTWPEPEDIEILKKIVREYKGQRIDFSILPHRPRFKYPRVNSGMTCNAEIRRRALAKAKSDPDGTGGSLSSLIELLLWKYLGCPPDVVETGPKR
ncbi:hypothetical protein Desti_3445 [Desulfomonile tiedjei DSM 6799]|uniref:Uncharacterized protein n=1 Tax=Desulfomonile tiedjei (strain ATCC 49306 / DSM 6799 / DCB-1) TaxID=706587 RepID=I4C956_DESTA|nr:hypothetical protein Desti_3445 [Desulfomonile tiedjei DSM 6799]